MSVFVRHVDTLKGAWPRAKTTSGWKTPTRVFAKKDDAWWEIARNSIKVVLGDPEGAMTVIENFNLRTHLEGIGKWEARKLRVEVTVLPNTYITSPFLGLLSARNPNAAFSTGTGWAIGSLTVLKNYGYILGAAGLPGRPKILVPATDPQNIEQAFDIESRVSQKLSLHKVRDHVLHLSGGSAADGNAYTEDYYYRDFVDVAGGVTDELDVDVGDPTNGGDAIENYTTLVIYNYGKVYGGGGGGGSFPNVAAVRCVSARKRPLFNDPDGNSFTRRAYAEQAPRMGGFGAGDLRTVAETKPGGVARKPRITLANLSPAVAGYTNYGTVITGGFDSDLWGVGGRLSANAIYYSGGALTAAGHAVYAVLQSLSGKFRHNNYSAVISPGATTVRQNPAGFSLTEAAAGVYAGYYGTFGSAGRDFWREEGSLKIAGVDRYVISGGEGGDWGADGWCPFIAVSVHDTDSDAIHDTYTKWGALSPDHGVPVRRFFMDFGQTKVEGNGIVNFVEAPEVAEYDSIDVDLYSSTFSKQDPAADPQFAVPQEGDSAIEMLLRTMGLPLRLNPLVIYGPVYSYSYNVTDSAFAGELKQINNRFSRMMKPGKGGRAIKGAAAVVFATPNNDGSYKGRFE